MPFVSLSSAVASARTFTSAKTVHAVPLVCEAVESALLQATLDPEVLAIAPVRPPVWSPDAHPAAHFVLTNAVERFGVFVAFAEGMPAIEAHPGRLRTVVIRPADLDSEPFAANVRMVWACARRSYPAGDQVRVMQFLQEHGASPLIEVAQAASASSDPVATVLAMACRDLVELDLRSGPLGPDTRVTRRLAP